MGPSGEPPANHVVVAQFVQSKQVRTAGEREGVENVVIGCAAARGAHVLGDLDVFEGGGGCVVEFVRFHGCVSQGLDPSILLLHAASHEYVRSFGRDDFERHVVVDGGDGVVVAIPADTNPVDAIAGTLHAFHEASPSKDNVIVLFGPQQQRQDLWRRWLREKQVDFDVVGVPE